MVALPVVSAGVSSTQNFSVVVGTFSEKVSVDAQMERTKDKLLLSQDKMAKFTYDGAQGKK